MSHHTIGRGLAALITLGTGFAATLPAQAHHSFAAFDRSKTLTLKGTVRKFQWMNPHVWLWVDVPNPQGGIVTWGLEASAPGEMARNGGWTKHTLNPGDKISVQVSPLKDGRPGGSMGQITLANGTVLGGRKDGGGPPGPGGAPSGFGPPGAGGAGPAGPGPGGAGPGGAGPGGGPGPGGPG